MRRIDRHFSTHESDVGGAWEIDFDPRKVGQKTSSQRQNFANTSLLAQNWDEEMFELRSVRDCCIRSDREGICRITAQAAGSIGILMATERWAQEFGERKYGGFNYFEVHVEKGWDMDIRIGLCNVSPLLNNAIGSQRKSIAIGLKNGTMQCEKNVPDASAAKLSSLPIRDGSVIGCGVSWEKGLIVFSVDGQLASTAPFLAKRWVDELAFMMVPAISVGFSSGSTGKFKQFRINCGSQDFVLPERELSNHRAITPSAGTMGIGSNVQATWLNGEKYAGWIFSKNKRTFNVKWNDDSGVFMDQEERSLDLTS